VSGRSALVWFRQDLRVDDHPALTAAVRTGAVVVPVFIWAPHEEGDWPPGAASRWWLHHSLEALNRSLKACCSRLIVRKGDSPGVLRALACETGAAAVFWNRRYEPAAARRDAEVAESLRSEGLTVKSFNSALLFEPDEVRTGQGGPFRVFTPFWKACLAAPARESPLARPVRLAAPRSWPKSLTIAALDLLPRIGWADGLRGAWQPGEAGAKRVLDGFVGDAIRRYDEDRNRPDLPGSSRLSPHLHWGEISPRRIWYEVLEMAEQRADRSLAKNAASFLRELGWREFAHHLLCHYPHTPTRPLREEFARFPWRRDAAALRAWQQGRTGYPIVDAGMRELWATGWMHNRVRMIVASFLVKDLLIPWQEGAKWFWDTLVDADLANNTLGWQWTAGCGADAAPYFRVFNPAMQGAKFDPDGVYVRRWVPELAKLPSLWIHRPHEADSDVLSKAGVRLGGTYPFPIVDHAEARLRALAAFGRITAGPRGESRPLGRGS
jgi:deoxyribodipyrimidine photo-lyase